LRQRNLEGPDLIATESQLLARLVHLNHDATIVLMRGGTPQSLSNWFQSV